MNKKYLIALSFVFGLPIITYAWTPPSGSPPSNNVSAPLNVGPNYQYKTGDLQVGVLGIDGGAILGTVLGIGTVSPDAPLHISSASGILAPSIVVHQTTGSANLRRTGLAVTNGRTYISSYNDDMSLGRIGITMSNLDAKVKIGGTGGAPVYQLQVGDAGDGSAVGASIFLYTSDAKFKTNVTTIENALDKVLQLRGVNFNWKSTGAKDIGLIAQEVEKVFPESVSTVNDTKSVDYGHLVAPLIEAVKEQHKQIQDLKAKVAELEASIK